MAGMLFAMSCVSVTVATPWWATSTDRDGVQVTIGATSACVYEEFGFIEWRTPDFDWPAWDVPELDLRHGTGFVPYWLIMVPLLVLPMDLVN